VDYLIADSPENVLASAEAFFARDWRHGGSFKRGNVSVDLSLFEPTIWERLGCLGLLLNTAIWAVSLGFAGKDDARVHTASVIATPEDEKTRLTVRSSRGDWLMDLSSWAESLSGSKPA
jgi:hypothetical protein